MWGMSEIAEFLHHGAEQITPKILHGIHKKLPALKLQFAEISAPEFPHLVEQLEFLADVVEDFVEEPTMICPTLPSPRRPTPSSTLTTNWG